jgi:hypothetical protein
MSLQQTTDLPQKRRALLWVTAAAVLVRILIIVSYPPIIAGDGADY